MLQIYDISVGHVREPSLIPCETPKIGWKLRSDRSGVRQVSFRIVLEGADGSRFDSGVTESASVTGHTIPGAALSARTEYTVTVTAADDAGETASASIRTSTGLRPEDWGEARWIRPVEHISGWSPFLRTKFTAGKVRKAILYACGLGCAEYYVNGQRADDAFVDPPITNYEKTVLYRRYDVTALLREGGNALAVWLGQGFYAQDRVWGIGGLPYGKECAIVRLELTGEDGSEQVVVSDTEHWTSKYSPITVNNIYGGETYDCRLETPDFASFDGTETGWTPVAEDETPKGVLRPCTIPPVRVLRELPAVSMHGVSGRGDGVWVYDVGVNMAGIAEFRLPPSPRGAVYVFRFGETLNAQGGVDYRSAGSFATQCLQQEIYICRGDKDGETYRPRFCYHGFRYVEVSGVHDFSEGYGTTPQLGIVRGLQLSTDFQKTGDFSCDSPDWTRMYRIMDNTFRSNFHGIPEDCPAREKCGWLGDAQIVCNFGLLTYDSAASYLKYLDDIRTTCEVYGGWQMISPGKRGCGEATPLWGCAQILIPYTLWQYTGDEDVLRDNFDLMEEWVRHEEARSTGFVITEGLGDWCPATGSEHPHRMPVEHSSTLMFYEICVRMEEICRVLGLGDPARYGRLAEQIGQAIRSKFYDAEKHTFGYLGSDGAALMLGLVPQGEEDAFRAHLLHALRETGWEMSTGIYANKYLIPAMLELGLGEEAAHVLYGRDHSSFGTMMDDRATSLWEQADMRFIEDRPVGSVSSYNHPMHGGYLYAVYTHLAGIRPGTPGFGTVRFDPCFTGDVRTVSAAVETPFGPVSSSICAEDGGYVCRVSVPAGAALSAAPKKGFRITADGRPIGERLGSGVHTLEYRRTRD